MDVLGVEMPSGIGRHHLMQFLRREHGVADHGDLLDVDQRLWRGGLFRYHRLAVVLVLDDLGRLLLGSEGGGVFVLTQGGAGVGEHVCGEQQKNRGKQAIWSFHHGHPLWRGRHWCLGKTL